MQRFNAKSHSILKLVFGILCSTGAAHADTYTDSRCSPTDGSKPAFDCNLFNKDKSVFFVNAEFLYWLVNEGAVDYAVKMDQPAWSSTRGTHAVGNYENAHYEWAPGFRVNFGHFNAPHFWDVVAQYTYVPANGSRHAHAPKKSGEFLNGTWTQPDVGTGTPPAPLHKASCHVGLKYNVLDLMFTRRFHTNEHLRIGVSGGITSAIIFQKMKISYEDINDQHSHANNRWRFEGVGFRAGVKVDWFMGWNIFMTGQLSTAILSGWYKNSSYQKTSATIPGADSSRPFGDTRFHDNRLTYTAQAMIGPSWQKVFKNVRTELVFSYEMNIWTNLQEIRRSGFALATEAKPTFINNSNISLQGLTIRLNVDF